MGDWRLLLQASCPCDSVRRPYSWSLRFFDRDAAGAGRARHRGVSQTRLLVAPGQRFWQPPTAKRTLASVLS